MKPRIIVFQASDTKRELSVSILIEMGLIEHKDFIAIKRPGCLRELMMKDTPQLFIFDTTIYSPREIVTNLNTVRKINRRVICCSISFMDRIHRVRHRKVAIEESKFDFTLQKDSSGAIDAAKLRKIIQDFLDGK